jgi:hypothetical protein
MIDEGRINLRLPPVTANKVRALAKERNQTLVGLVREAVGVLQTAHQGGKDGLYLGLAKHRENLETVLVSP